MDLKMWVFCIYAKVTAPKNFAAFKQIEATPHRFPLGSL